MEILGIVISRQVVACMLVVCCVVTAIGYLSYVVTYELRPAINDMRRMIGTQDCSKNVPSKVLRLPVPRHYDRPAMNDDADTAVNTDGCCEAIPACPPYLGNPSVMLTDREMSDNVYEDESVVATATRYARPCQPQSPDSLSSNNIRAKQTLSRSDTDTTGEEYSTDNNDVSQNDSIARHLADDCVRDSDDAGEPGGIS